MIKYFNVKDFLIQVQKQFHKKSLGDMLVFLSSPRNIGKSYSSWKLADECYLKPNARTVYMRITDKQLEKPRREFKAKFKGKYHLSGDVIYNVIEETLENNKTGEVTIRYIPNEIVGYFCSINNYTNDKSNEFENVKFIFIDEIIEDTNAIVGIYAKIQNLMTTIMRLKKDVLFLLVANRDTANNDFMVKWGIEPREEEDYYDDVIYQVSNRMFYCELGDKWYVGMGNQDTLFHEFAQFDNNAKRQLSGGYLKDFSRQIKNFEKWGKPTFKPILAVTFDEHKIYFGSCIFENTQSFFLVSDDDFSDLSVPSYALNNIAGMNKNTNLIEKDDIDDIISLLFFKIRNQQIFYNSFDTFNIIKLLMKLYNR